MEYNTTRNHLEMREYGRHVQKMVDHMLTIEDRERRQANALAVIELMGFLNPQLKNQEDFRHKLWDHLFLISDFKLDVDSPYPIPTRESLRAKPQPLKYPKRYPKYSHLGVHLETIINKALAEENPEKRSGFAHAIAYYMKLAYKTWNKDLNVGDETIKNDLKALSNGKLSMSPEASIEDLNPNPQQLKKGAPQPPQHQQPRSQQHNNQQGKRQGQQRNNKNKPWKRK